MGDPVVYTDGRSAKGRVDPPPYTDSDRPKGRVRGSDPPPLPVAYTDSSQRLGREGPDPPLPLHGRYCAQREAVDTASGTRCIPPMAQSIVMELCHRKPQQPLHLLRFMVLCGRADDSVIWYHTHHVMPKHGALPYLKL